MQRPEQHQIDSQAEIILKDELPKNWVCADIKPDYGIDHQIIVADGIDLAGRLAIDVQLKGKKRVKGSKPPTHPLEVMHLKYYMTRRLPVFLIVVDNERRTPYWIFMQQYADECLSGKQWESQKTITIPCKYEQIVSDTTRFRKAIEDANDYMTGKHPGPPQTSVLAEKAKIESIDPRFKISITATENSVNYDISAKDQPVPFKLVIKGSEERKRQLATDLLLRGLPVQVESGEIEIQGSPLFDNGPFSQLKSIHFAASVQQDVHLVVKNEKDKPELIFPSATFEGGPEECRLNANLFNGLIALRGTYTPNKPAHLLLNYNLAKWFSQPLMQLPYFDQLGSLITSMHNGSDIELYFSREGNRTFAGCLPSLSEKRRKQWSSAVSLIDMIKMAREVAKRFNVAPLLPPDLNRDDYDTILELYRWTNYGTRPIPKLVTTFVLQEQRILDNPEAMKKDGLKNGTLNIRRDPSAVPFLRQTITLPPLAFTFTHMIGTVRRAQAANGGVPVRWKATKNSTLTIGYDNLPPTSNSDFPHKLAG